MNLVTLSIPLFFMGIGLELWAARSRGGVRRYYDLRDSIGNAGTGILDQTFGAVTGAAMFAVSYLYFHEHRLLASWPTDSPLTWLGTFAGADFVYYWWHRASHRMGFFWAAHVVHHQSREYNLSVALRQSAFTSVTSAFFYAPLALLGAPPEVFIPCKALDQLYQFWIHTRLIGKLGPLEWFFNTPSHHRVHHGTNAPYLDRNYAGTFIIWDRLFGTFAEEREGVRYGTLHPLNGYEAVRANFHTYSLLARLTPHVRGWRERVLLWLGPPERRPRLISKEAESLLTAEERYPVGPGARTLQRSFFAFVGVLVGGSVFLFNVKRLPAQAQILGALAIAAAVYAVGRVLDHGGDPVTPRKLTVPS